MKSASSSLHAELGAIDDKLIDLLYERLQIVDRIAELKAPVLKGFLCIDPTREFNLLIRIVKLGEAWGISRALVYNLWRVLITHTNLHEQVNLHVLIPDDFPTPQISEVTQYYPILKHIFYKNTHAALFSPSETNIIVLELKRSNFHLLAHFYELNFSVYHVLDNNDNPLLLLGKIFKLYSAPNGRFVFLCFTRHTVEIVEYDKYQKYLDNTEEYLFIGSSAPRICLI